MTVGDVALIFRRFLCAADRDRRHGRVLLARASCAQRSAKRGRRADAPADVVARLRRAYGFDNRCRCSTSNGCTRRSAAISADGRDGRPVAQEMSYAIGNSVALALVAAAIGFSLGCLFGGIAGYARRGFVDKIASFLALLGVSVPITGSAWCWSSCSR